MRNYIVNFSVSDEFGEHLYYGPYVSIVKEGGVERIVFPGDSNYPDTVVIATAYADNEEEEKRFITRTKEQMGK